MYCDADNHVWPSHSVRTMQGLNKLTLIDWLINNGGINVEDGTRPSPDSRPFFLDVFLTKSIPSTPRLPIRLPVSDMKLVSVIYTPSKKRFTAVIIPNSIKVALGFGQLGIGKLLFAVTQAKHCIVFRMPKCPMSNCQWPIRQSNLYWIRYILLEQPYSLR